MAILDVRPRARRFAMLPAVAVALLALPIAAVRPATAASVGITENRFTSNFDRPAAGAPSSPVLASPAQSSADDDSVCDWNYRNGTAFSGTISITREGSREVVHEQIGRRGALRVIQKTFGDTRLCMIAEGLRDDDDLVPSRWAGAGRRTVLESRRGNETRRLAIEGGRRVWTVNGTESPAGADADAWQARVIAVLDPAWELAMLRGEQSSLRGEISSIYGERSSLQGEISSLYGEVSSLRGEISSIVGDESSLRGEISAIYGDLSSLQGEISSLRGDISSLTAERYDATDAERARIADRIKRNEAEIARIEQRVREFNAAGRVAEVERRIAALDAAGKIAAIERRIRDFDLDKRVKDVQARIDALDVDRRVAELERRIAALDVDGRAPQLQERLDAALRALTR